MEATNIAEDDYAQINEVTRSQFAWLETFADMSGIGCAVISQNLDIEFTTDQFFKTLELGAQSPITSFLALLDAFAARGDFAADTAEPSKTSILRALDDQLTSGREDKFSTAINLPSGQVCEMHLKALGDQRILISLSPAMSEANMLRQILDIGSSGYWIYSPKTQEFTLYADKFFKHSHYDAKRPDRLEDIWQYIHPEDIAKCRAGIAAVMKTQRRTELTIRANTGSAESLWLRAELKPVIGRDGAIETLYCHFTNTTRSLRAQNQMRSTIDRLEKSLKGKTDFLGRLSHEVRTPMNAVIGISDALIHHHGDPEILPKLELIQVSAEKIVRIVDETLQHSKLEEDKIQLNPRSASPKKSVRSVFRLWEAKALQEDIAFSCQIDPSVPDELFFDDHRWEQCLNNLVSNAVKFTRGGKIQIVLTTLGDGDAKQLILAVKDTGIGMTPDELKLLFDAYTQADKSISGQYGGTGLGMHITKRVIELMGGKISVRSIKGQGSVFALSLPMESVQHSMHEDKSSDLVKSMLKDAAPKQSDYSQLTVLVVDDNATNHMVVSSLLGSLVKNIITAEDGKEAIDVLASQHVDIILMDIHMPGMDGIEATLSIRASDEPWSDVPIIALTADPQYQQKRLCKNIGMNSALAKPVKLNEIIGALDAVIAETVAETAKNIAQTT